MNTGSVTIYHQFIMTRNKVILHRLAILLLPAFLLLLWPISSSAHGLRIFAWVSGDTVTVESSFSGGRALARGEVTVSESDSDTVLLAGTTDPDGTFRFPLPDSARTQELLITVSGGEGHQAQWRLEAQETGLKRPTTNAVATADQDLAASTLAQSTPAPPVPRTLLFPITPVAPWPSMTPETLEQLDHLLNEKLAPIQRDLARLQERKPDLRDILGGIGYLLGLAGILAWAKSQKK